MSETQPKVGDTVLIESRHSKRISNIERETKLYWVIDGEKYSKRNKFLVGGSPWVTTRFKVIDQEQEDKIRKQFKATNCRRKIEECAKTLSDDLAIQIYELITKQQEDKQ